MSENQRKDKPDPGRKRNASAGGRAEEGAPRAGQAGHPTSKSPKAKKSWMATHGRDLRFLGVFAALMGVYFIASTTNAMEDRFFPWYLRVSAQACGGILHAVGYDDVRVQGNSLISTQGRGAVSVERGCDAIAPSALFIAAVLASPVALRSRLLAVVVGMAALMAINLIRIVSLYLTMVHWRAAFDVMHLDVWQSLFIFLAILFWAVWASWERVRSQRRRHAAA